MAKRRIMSVLVTLCAAMPACVAAQAVTPGDAEAGHHAALHALPRACAADYDRLCPHPEGARDASAVLICLKDHMIDTSLSCREVVREARQ